NDTATTEIYTLSLHDALPICKRTNRSSPKSPANMLPFTNAARLPNIGRIVTAGSSGTSFANAALACSLGFGIAPPAILLMSFPRSSGGYQAVLIGAVELEGAGA